MRDMRNDIVRTEGQKKYYRLGDNTVKALDGVDFSVKEREFVAIIGRSGSGKSTLLHMIGGLDVPTAGEVYVDGKRLSGMNREQLAVFRRRKVGFVFQNYNLVPDLNVYDNVVLPIELDGKRIDRKFVREIMELLQIDEKAEALPGMLSGGQQQRVAIARAVAAKPSIILADEPTGNLDTASGHDVMGLLKVAAKQFQQTVDTEIDKEDFMAGKVCVLYRNGLDLTMDDLAGKTVTCSEYGNQSNSHTFQIAGLTDEGYYTGPLLGFPPTVITSASVVNGFITETYVSKAAVRYAEEYSESTEQEVMSLIGNSPDADDFSWESKLESMQEVERAQGNMKEVGIGIALILALIGILNYINTVTGNIQSRQMELAILESVGMTDRQRNRLLVMEGLLFAAGAILLTGTVGLAVTYAVYQSMNYMQVPFMVPVWPVVGMTVFIAAICVIIPLAAGALMVRKGSVMERVRGV